MLKCAQCLTPFRFTQVGRGRPPKYCSDACREAVWGRVPNRLKPHKTTASRPARVVAPYVHGTPRTWRSGCRCDDCKTAYAKHYRDRYRAAQGIALDAPKGWRRSAQPQSYVCDGCGETFTRKTKPTKAHVYCTRDCFQLHGNLAKRIRDPRDDRDARYLREKSAPGLGYNARRRLLKGWLKQGRTCTYCDAHPTTIDHVLPLVRGGTNHEGNLTPCCKPCNSSKGGLTIIEWRTGRRLPPMTDPLPWCYAKPRAKAQPKPAIQLTLPLAQACDICGQPTLTRYCKTGECESEGLARRMRDLYRARHGIPVDPTEPTSKYGRRSAA